MRKLLLNIHLWLGLAAALFLLLRAGSGALLVFENEIDHALNAKYLDVQPAGDRLPPSAIGERLSQKYPGSKLAGVQFPSRSDGSYAVFLTAANGKNIGLL